MTLKFLLEKEFKQLARNKIMLALTGFFPLMVILVMPWAATMDIKNIRLTVVDNDRSPLSEEFVDKLAHSTYFRLVGTSPNYREGIEAVEVGEADMVLEIPDDFENSLTNTGSVPVQVSVNAVNSMLGSMAQSYITTFCREFSQDLQAANPDTAGIPTVQMTSISKFNPTMDYKYTMIPALIMISLLVLCGYLSALNIVVEKEQGTIEQLNVTPISRTSFVFAKLIPFWIIGFVSLTLGFFFAWLVYGLSPAGSLGWLYFFSALFIFAMTGFGLVISNKSSTLQQAVFVMFFFAMIFIMLSGLLTPVDSMPAWAQVISALCPTTYIVDALRNIYLKGSGFLDLLPDFIALATMLVVFNVWAVLSYKKSE